MLEIKGRLKLLMLEMYALTICSVKGVSFAEDVREIRGSTVNRLGKERCDHWGTAMAVVNVDYA